MCKPRVYPARTSDSPSWRYGVAPWKQTGDNR
nr:MAG TPA_asm: hypothetical protein [Caudoviricetes sp.]